MLVPDAPAWKIDLPKAPEGAKWTPAPRVVETLHFKQDRRGFMESGYVHLFVVSADGGTPREVTKGKWSVGARFDQLPGGVTYGWLPDGRTIVVEGYQDSTGADRNYRDDNIYAVDIERGTVRRLTPERGSWQGPVVSPDGRRIAFTGTPYGTYSYHAADVYVMNADGSGVRSVSREFDRDPSDLTWSADGGTIYFSAQDRGTQNVFAVPAAGGAVRQVTSGTQMLTLGSVSRTGVAVGVPSAPQARPGVVRCALRRPGEPAQLTHVNDDLLE